MNRDELLATYDRQLRFESTDPLSERQAIPADAPLVVRHVPLDPNARWGWVIWSRLTEAIADQLIAEQVAFFIERGQNFEWKRYGYDGPADLDERLLRHGFSREELESVMVMDLENGRDFGDARASDVEICRITDPANLDKVVQIEDAVWHESHAWIAEELRYELMLPDEPLLMYLAYAEGVPASAAWIRFHKGTDFAALFGGSTLPEYRRRGLYTALLDVRAKATRERGYRFLSVDASEMSRPILEKRGFVKVTTATAYKYRVSNEPD
jgi:GNAT superfamily N-acetyltransferase